MNSVTLLGYMTRDPELRYSTTGKAVVTGCVAVNRNWTSETGEKKEEVSFIDWTAFGRTGEVIAQYLKKGDPFLCEGRLQQQRWDDKADGRPRSKVVVIVERQTFVPSRKRDGGESAPSPQPGLPKPANVPCGADGTPVDDSDVPF